jgi:hypothetical protein
LEFHSGHEADHSPPSSAEVKEWVELYLHSQYAFMERCSDRGSTGTTLQIGNDMKEAAVIYFEVTS